MHVSSNTDHGGFNADRAAIMAALDLAHARSFHSYFTQYVLVDEDEGYVAVDEGAYNALPKAMLDRVVEAVPSKLSDEN